MVSWLAAAAKESGAILFRRFALMRHWHVHDGISFDQMINNFDENQPHQNAWSYHCMAEALTEAIANCAVG